MLEKFCLVSSKESISHNKVSVLAIFEILLSVCLYWYIIPTYLNIYYHIVFALAITFFFLLRSDESQKEALELLQNYYSTNKQNLSKRMLKVLVVVILLCLIYFLTNYLSLYWLTSYEGFSLFWRSFFVGLGLWILVGVIGLNLGKITLVLGLAVGLVGLRSVELVGIIGIGIGLVGAVPLVIIVGLKKLKGVGIGGVVGIGGLLIIIILSMLIKVLVGFKYLLKGRKNISLNWKTINLYQDIFYTPEILIGINNFDGLDRLKLDSSIKSKDIGDTVINLTMKILYVPAMIYRISLKSTALIYLVFFMTIPYFVNTKLENKYMAARLKNMFWVVASMVIIFISLGNNIFDIKYLSDISAFIHSYNLLKDIIYLFLSYAICTFMLYPFGVYLKEEKSSIKRYVVNVIRYIQISSLAIAIFLSILFIHNEFYPIESITEFLNYINETFFKSLEDVRELLKKVIAHNL